MSKDESLKQKFVELSQKYQGQPMDEVRALSIMEQEALPLAAQMGYSFTIDDVNSYELEMQKATNGCEMSDAEMEVVTGGGWIRWCTFFGYDYYIWTSGTGNAGKRFILAVITAAFKKRI